MMKLYLALAGIALLVVIAAQDYLYVPLRNETISKGLAGPYHWFLDAAYLMLAIPLIGATSGWMRVWGTIAAASLLLVASTNTFAATWDRWTGGKHSLWHSRFTIVVFASALLLQCSGDTGWLKYFTVANVIAPAVAYLYFMMVDTVIDGVHIAPSPAAEKLAVAGLCFWFLARMI